MPSLLIAGRFEPCADGRSLGSLAAWEEEQLQLRFSLISAKKRATFYHIVADGGVINLYLQSLIALQLGGIVEVQHDGSTLTRSR